ncbi:hypothetical protein NN561_004862 [Cricetulus griseus]
MSHRDSGGLGTPGARAVHGAGVPRRIAALTQSFWSASSVTWSPPGREVRTPESPLCLAHDSATSGASEHPSVAASSTRLSPRPDAPRVREWDPQCNQDSSFPGAGDLFVEQFKEPSSVRKRQLNRLKHFRSAGTKRLKYSRPHFRVTKAAQEMRIRRLQTRDLALGLLMRLSRVSVAARGCLGPGVAPEVAVPRVLVLVGNCERNSVIEGGAAPLSDLRGPLQQPWRKAESPSERRRGRCTRPRRGTGQRGRVVPPLLAAETT